MWGFWTSCPQCSNLEDCATEHVSLTNVVPMMEACRANICEKRTKSWRDNRRPPREFMSPSCHSQKRLRNLHWAWAIGASECLGFTTNFESGKRNVNICFSIGNSGHNNWPNVDLAVTIIRSHIFFVIVCTPRGSEGGRIAKTSYPAILWSIISNRFEMRDNCNGGDNCNG